MIFEIIIIFLIDDLIFECLFSLFEMVPINVRGVLLVPFFFKLVTLAGNGKGLEDDGLSGRGREVA